MEKMKMQTGDVANENFRKLAELFPNAVTETIAENGEVVRAIDKDILMQEISTRVIEGNEERYQFTWPDKRQAMRLASTPIAAALRPCREESVDFDTTENLYIEGDNLDVLKLLRETYLGKVKMIYIDPPYNTGNDFVYEDDFSEDAGEFLMRDNQYDDQRNRLVQNTDSNGRFHTDWLNMIYPRLKIAKDLLSEDGVIFISIDDNEVANLRKVCDEVFGEGNFIDNIIWKKRYGGGAKEKYLVSLHEYVLMYCKDIKNISELFIPLTKEAANSYYTKRDEKYPIRGGYRTHPLEAGKAMDSRPNLIYPIPAPDGTLIMPKRQWLWSKERTYEALKNNDLEITKGNNGEWTVSSKQYLKDELGNTRPGKMFSIIEDIYTQHGTNEMISIMGNAKIFSYPKPSEFIKRLMLLGGKHDLILDFFSGAASTAQAVMQLNAEDGGSRKFIMVQLPEACESGSEAARAGYKNICEIGKERIRRAGKKITDELQKAAQVQKEEDPLFASAESTGTAEHLDIGFRVLKLDSTNMKEVYYNPAETSQDDLLSWVSNIKPDRTPEDLLFQVMLELGILPSSRIEKSIIAGKQVFNVADNFLIACFDENVTDEVVKAIAKEQPTYAVLRDSSFANDSVAANFEQIFATYSPDTVRRVL